jgi:hypothetical protein
MRTLWLILMAFVCLPAVILAQATRAPLRYDPSNEVAIRGTVMEVRQLVRSGTPHGTYLVLRTPTNILNVHLSPRALSAKTGASLKAGESVEVVGSLVSRGGSPILLARKVRTPNTVLTFRSDRGFPVASRR